MTNDRLYLKLLMDAVGALTDPEDKLPCVPKGPEKVILEIVYTEVKRYIARTETTP